MKKLFALILATVMILSLAACGEKETTPENPDTSNPSQSSEFKWPEKNVTVIVSSSAGGQSDLFARIVCGKLQEMTGKSFTVLNNEAGGGTVGREEAAAAAPDGYTLLVDNPTLISKIVTGTMENTIEDYTYLGSVNDPGIESAVIVVRKDSPFETIQDLIDYAKEHPGELQTGVSVGGAAHLVELLTDDQFGIEVEYLEAGSNAARTPLFVGGQFDLMMASTSYLKPYVDSGDVRPLVVTGAQRSAFYPDTPCMTELGYEATEQPMVWFFAGPAGLSDEFVENFNVLLEEALKDPSVQEQMTALKYTAAYMDAEATTTMVHDVTDAYTKGFALLNE